MQKYWVGWSLNSTAGEGWFGPWRSGVPKIRGGEGFFLFFSFKRMWVEVFFLDSFLLSTPFLLEGDEMEGHRHRLVGYLSQASRGSLRTSPQWSRDSASSNHRLHGTWGRRGALFLHGRTQVWEIFCFCFSLRFEKFLRKSTPLKKTVFWESTAAKVKLMFTCFLTDFSLSINLRQKTSWFQF